MLFTKKVVNLALTVVRVKWVRRELIREVRGILKEPRPSEKVVGGEKEEVIFIN